MQKKLMRAIALIACLASLCVTGPAVASNTGPDFEALNATWNEAFNGGDAAAVAALYHENAHLSPGNQKVLTGRAAIQELFQSFIDGGVHDHAIDIVDTHVNGDIAYEISNWSAKGAEKDGEKPTFGGVLLNIFERQDDGSWQSRLHIWN